MAANIYRGEVEFTLPMAPDGSVPGPTYLLKIGINEFIGVQSTLSELSGVHHLRQVLYTALTASLPAQAHLSLEDAGDFIDLLGIDESNALIAKTRWGTHTDKALEKAKAELERQQKLRSGPCPKCGFDPAAPATPLTDAERHTADQARFLKPKPNGASTSAELDPTTARITSSVS